MYVCFYIFVSLRWRPTYLLLLKNVIGGYCLAIFSNLALWMYVGRILGGWQVSNKEIDPKLCCSIYYYLVGPLRNAPTFC